MTFNPFMNLGTLLIHRTNWFDKSKWPHVKEKRPSIMLDHVDILRRYRGLEGELWPNNSAMLFNLGECSIAPLEKYNKIHAYYVDMATRDIDEIYDFISLGEPTIASKNNPLFLGFEAGYLNSPDNVFSCIFNDVIYGQYKELTCFARFLNKHLLFSSQEIARELLGVRNNLISKGLDLESDENFYVYTVMKPHGE